MLFHIGILVLPAIFALGAARDGRILGRSHAPTWPSVVASLKSSGIDNLELFRTGNRLVLIIDAPDEFSPAARAAADASNPDIQAWETLMWNFQRSLPWAQPGQKWVLMPSIFCLANLTLPCT